LPTAKAIFATWTDTRRAAIAASAACNQIQRTVEQFSVNLVQTLAEANTSGYLIID
jgi:hypothetical protein